MKKISYCFLFILVFLGCGDVEDEVEDDETIADVTKVNFNRHFNSEVIKSTIIKTKPFMATADPSEDFNGLYANGRTETFLKLTKGVDTLTELTWL